MYNVHAHYFIRIPLISIPLAENKGVNSREALVNEYDCVRESAFFFHHSFLVHCTFILKAFLRTSALRALLCASVKKIELSIFVTVFFFSFTSVARFFAESKS